MIHCGTSGWAYPSWKPDFYPAKLGPAKFLGYYATRLNSVEVNYTFRHLPGESILAKWIAETPAGFQFAVKAHQGITHIRRLHDAAEATERFLSSLKPLQVAGKLGPMLFQLPPYLPCDIPRLAAFLGILPRNLRAAMEFRHESWFRQDVYDQLRRANVAICQVESQGNVAIPVSTAKFSYFRFRKPSYSKDDLERLAEGIATTAPGADVFAYFKHEESPDGALYAEDLFQRLRRCPLRSG